MTDDDALIARLRKVPPPGEPFGPCTDEAKATFARSVAHYVDASEAADALAALTAELRENHEHFASARALIDEQRIRATQETERCAKVCEAMPKSNRPLSWGEIRHRFAAAIRAAPGEKT